MAKEQETQATTTTLNVSRAFASVLNEVARDANESIREYCDRELMPYLRPKAKQAIRNRLKAVELGGEAGGA